MAKTVFALKEIYFSYLKKFPALCGVDLAIEEGSKVALIGANGSGKSTLLHLLDGLIFPDRGSFSAFGRELKERDFSDEKFSRDFRKKVGLVFQNADVQLFCPTVREDIVFGPLQLGMGREEIEKRLQRLVDILQIKDLLTRPPHQLSIGEKRKVAIASTLVIGPEILILDEPTAGLDPLTVRHIIDLLNEENAAGKTIVTATHDLHLVEEMSELVFVFSQARRIVTSGSPEAILRDTALLEAHNLVHIHSHKHKDKIHVHPHAHWEHHSES
ncbi:MAG: ABC transporter ATP-binding protein [Candidatus Omnitrophica bacterium]|nr:ABC transporter ATP-binding protein [Candidatus Omnitrophota bacterium]MDD5236436.1 ABC transporter ATP-binding protein [Candidatus Omnitrophota bacterium]MDD5611396.1 ABC transporter ATP-binding protein [Candidatus Omnitrophota bacterium]